MSDHPRALRENFSQVSAWVEETRRRSGWPVRRILADLDIAPASYYRLRARQAAAVEPGPVFRPARRNIYELLPEERMLVLDYALTFPDPRHRALAYEMADAGIVCASPASIYRVLKEKRLVPGWQLWRSAGTAGPVRERAQMPDARWLFDLTYIRVIARWWYLAYLMDEYSRYVVYWELMLRMDEYAVSVAVERALALPGRSRLPEIQTDNGPAFKSGEFRRYLAERGIEQRRIRPHRPTDNAIVERGIRTLKELAGARFDDNGQAQTEIGQAVRHYNFERRHSALCYLRPFEYYRGSPAGLLAERAEKTAAARSNRRQVNLALNRELLAGRKRLDKQAKDSSNPMPVLSHFA